MKYRTGDSRTIGAYATVGTLVGAAILCAAGLSPAGAACVPAAFPNGWLLQQEAAGGRTIALHVGRTDQQLVQRLADFPQIEQAGSFPDVETAQATITGYLSAATAKVNQWAEAAGQGQWKKLNATGSGIVGRVAYRPASMANVRDTRAFYVILTADGSGGCVLTNATPALGVSQRVR